MDATLKLWSVVAIVGALNYVSRLSFIALFARRHVPPLAVRAFRYVPAAMPFAPSSGAVVMGGFWTRPEWEAAGGGRILL